MEGRMNVEKTWNNKTSDALLVERSVMINSAMKMAELQVF